MATIPTALRDLADRLEKFVPMPVPQGDDGEYWSLDVQLAGALLRYDNDIYDGLQLYESVEFASAFRERFDRLYEIAKSDDPNAMASFAWMICDLARYCRSLATAIESKFRANPPFWNVPSMLAGLQSAAGKMGQGETPPPGEQPAEDPQPSKAAADEGGPTPADPGSDTDNEAPEDLMYLNVVCKRYVVSKKSLFRHIKSKDKKLKNWPELSGNKFRVSKAEVELLYEPRATTN